MKPPPPAPPSARSLRYAKTLAKIQVTAIFSYGRHAEKRFPRIYRDLYGDAKEYLMLLHLQNAIHVTLYIIRRVFIS